MFPRASGDREHRIGYRGKVVRVRENTRCHRLGFRRMFVVSSGSGRKGFARRARSDRLATGRAISIWPLIEHIEAAGEAGRRAAFSRWGELVSFVLVMGGGFKFREAGVSRY